MEQQKCVFCGFPDLVEFEWGHDEGFFCKRCGTLWSANGSEIHTPHWSSNKETMDGTITPPENADANLQD